jgi:hypothetical protein
MNGSKRRVRALRLALASAVVVLVLVPAAASAPGQAQYRDAAGDNASAPDVTGVTVASDKASGQILFRIAGTNLSSSSDFPTFLFIDSDANPVTGDVDMQGADYAFYVDDQYYDFAHWDGTNWVDTPDATVRVNGGGNGVLISVNRSEVGNTAEFNFSVETADSANHKWDDAPDDGTFNYSLDLGGPDVKSVLLQTQPSAGPKSGKRFVVTPAGLQLPPNGALAQIVPKPENYTCRATLKGRAISGTGKGACTYLIPKKSRGKQLKVVVTVVYEGTTKPFTFPFTVS